LAQLYEIRGKTDQATDYANRALEVFRRLKPDSLNVALALEGIGLTAIRRGRFEDALRLFEETYRIRALLCPESTDFAIAPINIGLTYMKKGDFAMADAIS